VGTGEGSLTVRTTSGTIEAHINKPATVVLLSESGHVTATTTGDDQVAIAAQGGTIDVQLDGVPTHTDVQDDGILVAQLNRDNGSEHDTAVQLSTEDEGVLAIGTAGNVHVGLKSWFEASSALTSRLGSQA